MTDSGKRPRRRNGDTVFITLTAASAAVLLLLIAGFFLGLIWRSWPAMKEFGWGFLISTEWNPASEHLQFGALTSIFGTLVSTAIAILIAVPLSLAVAVFLAELAPPWLSKPVGQAIELLAAIPSIIYGMWGLLVFAPFMAQYVEPWLGKHLGFIPLFNGDAIGIGMLTTGIILALMILPFISAVMRDVFLMVPPILKESAAGMGATTWEVTRKITIRYGLRGIIGACFLGLGRAIGETMAVVFVIGGTHKISSSLFDPGTSIAATIANSFEEAVETPTYVSALIELALILLVITFALQVLANWWLGRVSRSIGAQ